MKLSKRESALQGRVQEILNQDILSVEDKEFVIENLNEAALVEIGRVGAFFTPLSLADEMAFEMAVPFGEGKRCKVLDLCAGVGILAYAANRRYDNLDIVCIEQNPNFVEIGKKLLPAAKWICASLEDTDLLRELGSFDVVISNPPYGNVPSMSNVQSPRYTGNLAHYKVLDIAAHLGEFGVFLLPQEDAGFKYSGARYYERHSSSANTKFVKETGLYFGCGAGHDTTLYPGFKNTKCRTEVVVFEFPWEFYYESLPIRCAQSEFGF